MGIQWKTIALLMPVTQLLSSCPRYNFLFLVLIICTDSPCRCKHIQVYIFSFFNTCGGTLYTLLCILLFSLCIWVVRYLTSAPLRNLFPVFSSGSVAVFLSCLCHFTHMQIYLWDEFLQVALLSQGVSLLFNFDRYCQIAPGGFSSLHSHRHFECLFSLPSQMSPLSNILLFVDFVSLSFVLHLSYSDWGWPSYDEESCVVPFTWTLPNSVPILHLFFLLSYWSYWFGKFFAYEGNLSDIYLKDIYSCFFIWLCF